jgi:TonB family protein
MLLDFDEYRSGYEPIGGAVSWREGLLLSFVWHLVMLVMLVVLPRYLPDNSAAARARLMALREQQEAAESTRFVFVQPRLDRPAPKPPERGERSDKDRLARTVERPPNPTNAQPFARGNTPERTEAQRAEPLRGKGPGPDPAAGPPAGQQQARAEDQLLLKVPEAASRLLLPEIGPPAPRAGADGRAATPGGSLGQALQNLERYIDRGTFDNQGGGVGEFGPAIQFDTKGVEFGPWIRRFIAQIKRNWFIPYAAMSMKGHVVITFNVHKDGAITDLSVVDPCPVGAFNNAAYGALVSSNPTTALPPEYPAGQAFFTVTFYYNEHPQ